MNFINRVIDNRPWARESRTTCDIEEKEKRYELRIEVPRARESDIMVAVMNGGRTLAVEVDNYKGKEVTRNDKLVKEFLLDERVVHIRKILAVLDDGVLKISVPRKTKDELTSVHMVPVHSPESMRQHFSRQKHDASKDNVVAKEQQNHPMPPKAKTRPVLADRKTYTSVKSESVSSSTQVSEPTRSESSPSNKDNTRSSAPKAAKDSSVQVSPKAKDMSEATKIPASTENEKSSPTKNPSPTSKVSAQAKELRQETEGLPSAEIDGLSHTAKIPPVAAPEGLPPSTGTKSVVSAEPVPAALKEPVPEGPVPVNKPEAMLSSDTTSEKSSKTEVTSSNVETKRKEDAPIENQVEMQEETLLEEKEDVVSVEEVIESVEREACPTEDVPLDQEKEEAEPKVIQKDNKCAEEAALTTRGKNLTSSKSVDLECQPTSERPLLVRKSFAE